MSKVQVSIYHDTRKAKISGLFPVKLRVYYREDKRLYPTDIDLSVSDFERSYSAQKPQKEYKTIKFNLVELEKKANDIVDELKVFTFDSFEKRMFRATGDNDNIIYYYNQKIAQLTKEERFGTASNYDLSLKSILLFAKGNRTNELKHLSFDIITPDFLNEFERWMLGRERGLTTVGMYLRPLRAVFNTGKLEKVVTEESYPFGKGRYLIPAGRGVKKALNSASLHKLYTHETEPGGEQEKARDYWFFSFQCNGMNFKDISHLKVADVQGSSIIFTRAKTRLTSKSDSKAIIVPITETVQAFIDKYSTGKVKTDYLFPILNNKMTPLEKHKKVQNFIRFVNQHTKNIAKDAGLAELSTYWARHSFSATVIRNGGSKEFVQESLGHKSISTTDAYFEGFEDETKKEVAENLMNFLKPAK